MYYYITGLGVQLKQRSVFEFVWQGLLPVFTHEEVAGPFNLHWRGNEVLSVRT